MKITEELKRAVRIVGSKLKSPLRHPGIRPYQVLTAAQEVSLGTAERACHLR